MSEQTPNPAGWRKISWLLSAFLKRCTAVAYRIHGHAQDHTPGKSQSEQGQNKGQILLKVTFLCTMHYWYKITSRKLKVTVYFFTDGINIPRLDISMTFDIRYFEFLLYQWQGLVILQPTSRGLLSFTVWGLGHGLHSAAKHPQAFSFCWMTAEVHIVIEQKLVSLYWT